MQFAPGLHTSLKPRPARRAGPTSAFTLIELIFVLALLAICATLVTSSLGSFFRGRALNFEARRLLSLTHYGHTRAVSEGVPVVLWVSVKDSTYGLTVLSSYNDDQGDIRARAYAVEAGLTLEIEAADSTNLSEQDDERLGLTEELAVIRFNPDGFFDPSSVRKITIRQSPDNALDLVQAANGLGYEVRPASVLN
ncbi:MAG: prepilin-type N-terminal cleavage/methylation domain-containing protein [Verrucomicrobia bacterium]|nr:prepilin-type N-terminal cleavage/methylation domain-containing protein [Verrucomicrobiota bacterium]